MQNTNVKYDQLIDSFLLSNIGFDKEFITSDLSKGLQQNLIHLQQNNALQQANIGNDIVKNETQIIRKDKIFWLDKSHDNIFEQQFLHHIDQFVLYLNSTCYTGINSYEFHYAIYEKGAFYKKHKDQFKNNNNRKFSLIHYLNDDWLEGDGGELNLYQHDSTNTILPKSQSAIFFKSNEIEHEVLQTNRARLSITGWLKTM
jgi:SM-20-related protein